MTGDDVFLVGLVVASALGGAELWRLRGIVRQRGTANWKLVLTGNLLLLEVLVSLAAAGGESYFRWGYDTTDSFVQTKVSRKWFERHWKENASGIRDNVDYASRRTAGRRRITFVGDSFTAGQGVNAVEDRFVNRLRQQHPEWEIHALAFPGMDTGGEVDYVRQACARGYELEDVVLVYCLNDISDLVTAWTKEVQQFQAEWEQRSWLRKHSFLVDTLGYRIGLTRQDSRSGYFDFVQSAYTNDTWLIQEARLKEFHRVVTDHGGRLRVVTFPFLHCLGDNYPLRAIHKQLDAFWKEQGVPHLDLLPTFARERPEDLMVNRLDAHPNTEAHTHAATMIERWLAKEQSEQKL